MRGFRDLAIKVTTYLGSAMAFVGAIFYEGSILAAVIALGPIKSFVLLSITAIIITNLLIYILSCNHNFTIIKRIKNWSENKQSSPNRLVAKFLNIGKLLGIIAASVIMGPLPTTLLIDILGYKKPYNYALATMSSILFSAMWVLIYGGGVSCVRVLLRQS